MLIDDTGALKVLHVAETVRGGIATYFNELHPHQRASYGRDGVHYVIPSDHRNDLIGFDDSEVSTFKRERRGVSGLFQMAIVACQQINRLQPDVIHIHSTFAGLVMRPLLFMMRGNPKIVYCPHGWAFGRETSRVSHQIAKLIERVLSKFTDHIICISRYERQEAIEAGIEPQRLTLVPNGISVDRPVLQSSPVEWRTSKTKILFIGRLDRQKGYDLLIDMARQLEAVVDVRILGSSVVGKSVELDLPGNVTLMGWADRPQIERHLDATDLVIIPSRWEAFGLVALEAMRSAKPIVAFNIGALPEIVEDGVTGVLSDPVSVDSLVEAVQKAINLNLSAAGQNGFERFKRLYDVKMTHRLLGEVYFSGTNAALPEAARQ